MKMTCLKMVELCTFIILKRVKDNRCFRLFSIVYETCKLKRTIKFVQAERSRDFGGPLVPADYYCCWCCCCCCFYSLYPFCSSVLSFRAKNAFKILLCECMCERSVIVGHISRYCFDARAILLVSLKKRTVVDHRHQTLANYFHLLRSESYFCVSHHL